VRGVDRAQHVHGAPASAMLSVDATRPISTGRSASQPLILTTLVPKRSTTRELPLRAHFLVFPSICVLAAQERQWRSTHLICCADRDRLAIGPLLVRCCDRSLSRELFCRSCSIDCLPAAEICHTPGQSDDRVSFTTNPSLVDVYSNDRSVLPDCRSCPCPPSSWKT
jgi:hypothetical protein